MPSEEKIANSILRVSISDLRNEFERLSQDPERLESELYNFAESVSKEDVLYAINKLGGPDKLIEKLLLFIAFKAALVRKGVKLGVAAGTAAGLCFGISALGHHIAERTGSTALDDLACDVDAIAQHASEISDTGFQIAHESIDFFQDAMDMFQSMFA